MSQSPEGPVYLTSAGRRRLEEQAARYTAQVAAWRGDEIEGEAGEDRGDEAERLIEADNLTPTRDMLARIQAVLARAVPMPEGAADGIARLGSTVTVRDEAGKQSRLMLVDPAEYHDGAREVAADSPVGRALSGQAAGNQVTIDVPAGRQVLTIQAVEPYREPAP